MRVRFRRLALLFVIALVAAACGSGDNEETSESAGGGDASVELNEMVERLTAEEPYKIGFTVPQFRDPFWISVAYGIEDEAEKAGIEVVAKYEAGSYANLGEQIDQIDDMTQRDLDAMIVAPVDSVGVVPALDNAGDAGIPVIGAANTGQSEAMFAAITWSDHTIGVDIADAIGEHLSGEGSIVMLNGPDGADWSTNRTKGFKEQMAAEYPDIEILEEMWLNPDREAGQATMEDWLQKHGDDIDAVFSGVSLTAEGAVLALRNAGRNGEVFVGTSSMSKSALEMIEAGDIQFCYAEPGQLTGRLAVQYLIRQLEGKELPHLTETEAGSLPSQLVYIALPPVTPDTVDAFDPYLHEWAPDDYQP